MTLREEFENIYKNIGTNLCSFGRDYHDVENFYSLIQIGTREENNKKLVQKCWELVDNYRKQGLYHTPDFGGALCVIGYNDRGFNHLKWMRNLKKYLDNMNYQNPHCIRWAISLCYLAGTITNKQFWYNRCTTFDWRKFNALILTKILTAYERLARIAMNKGQKQKAINLLNTALETYKEGLSQDMNDIVGNKKAWVYFGFCELALLSDIASQLVVFLANIDIYGTMEFENKFDSKRFGMLKWCQQLENEIQYLRRKHNDFN